MKAYKVTTYNSDIEGKNWSEGKAYYYTTKEKAEAKADEYRDGTWTNAKVEEITVEEQHRESTKVLSSATIGKAWPLRGGASRSVLSIHRGLQKSVVDKEATDQAQKNPKKIIKILLKSVDKIVKVWYYNSVKRGT